MVKVLRILSEHVGNVKISRITSRLLGRCTAETIAREDWCTDIEASKGVPGRPEVEVGGYKETRLRSDRPRDKSGRGKAQVYRAIIYG